MVDSDQDLIAESVQSIWWLVLLRGISVLLLGIMFFINPGISLIVIMMFLGGYWFVDGIIALVTSIKEKKNNKSWGWGVFVSLLSILAGIAVFMQPILSSLFTTTFLVYFMGFLILTSGFSSIFTGFKLRKTSGQWVMVLWGVLSVILGFLLLINPLFSAQIFIIMLGIIAIIGGITGIVLSFKIKKVKSVDDLL